MEERLHCPLPEEESDILLGRDNRSLVLVETRASQPTLQPPLPQGTPYDQHVERDGEGGAERGCTGVRLKNALKAALLLAGIVAAAVVVADERSRVELGGSAYRFWFGRAELTATRRRPGDASPALRYGATGHGRPPQDLTLAAYQAPAPASQGAATGWMVGGGHVKLDVAPVSTSKAPTTTKDDGLPSLFCFLLVGMHGEETWLVRAQWHKGLGVFACNTWRVFSQKTLWLGKGPAGDDISIAIPGPEAYMGAVKGQGEQVWHNTGPFMRAWGNIHAEGKFRKYDFVVKVDPDAVFSPHRLQVRLNGRVKAGSSVYFLNCAKWGSLQGPLEVFTAHAAEKFFSNVDKCKQSLAWDSWGEDWFMGRCMSMVGISNMAGYDFLDDKWCEHRDFSCAEDRVAFHPFKTQDDYMRCVEEAGIRHK